MITHPEKVLFPDDGITKGELAKYYEMIAPIMIPHIKWRPVTMERYPRGIHHKGFIQKNVSKGFPEWLKRVEVPKKDGTVNYPLVHDTRSLLWVVNQNTVTPHVWTSRVPKLNHPDLCVFDLDPSEEDQRALRAAALGLRELLDELGLPSWVKTSGSKGYHIVVPLDSKTEFDDVAAFTHAVARVLMSRDPRHSRSSSLRRIVVEGSLSMWAAPAERDLFRAVRGAGKADRACIGAMSMGGGGKGRSPAAHIHPAVDGRTDRRRG
jgi:bifunctional non-homologous end joining protein LigD